MKLIEYFFYGIARCCFWILPGRALENEVPCAARGASVTSHKKRTASFT